MKLAMRPIAFIFLLTLVHMSETCSLKQSSESIKTPNSVSFVLGLIEESPKNDSVVVFRLN